MWRASWLCRSRRVVCGGVTAACGTWLRPTCMRAGTLLSVRRSINDVHTTGDATGNVNSRPMSGMMMGGPVEDTTETHPDFQPRIVASDLAEDEVAMIKKDIEDTIKTESIVVFIKGVPEAPMCAFSKRMIDVLEALGVEYTSFDVLAHPVVRTHVKELSEWPTIPQLFVAGEFVGGMDIVLKLAESGQLQVLLDEKHIKHRDQK